MSTVHHSGILTSDLPFPATDPTVTKIADKHGVHPARILVSLWANVDGVAGKCEAQRVAQLLAHLA
jgi:hypothetical protein